MSRLSALAVSQRSVTLLLSVALFVAGIAAWGSLKQELLPDVDFPVITIIAPYPGAGASEVASQIAEPIERSIQGVARLDSVRSTSANSIALVVAQFEFGTNVKETRATIEENIRGLGLPQGVEPTVSALNINASPVIIASVAATAQSSLDRAAEIDVGEKIAGRERVGAVEQLVADRAADRHALLGQRHAQPQHILRWNHDRVAGRAQAIGNAHRVEPPHQLLGVRQREAGEEQGVAVLGGAADDVGEEAEHDGRHRTQGKDPRRAEEKPGVVDEQVVGGGGSERRSEARRHVGQLAVELPRGCRERIEELLLLELGRGLVIARGNEPAQIGARDTAADLVAHEPPASKKRAGPRTRPGTTRATYSLALYFPR